ncbi:hypothetical protein ABBQ38_011399 [Trebouxia sp. C0009 RCD-2024]
MRAPKELDEVAVDDPADTGHIAIDAVQAGIHAILSLAKAETYPKARPITEGGSAEADSSLVGLGLLQFLWMVTRRIV